MALKERVEDYTGTFSDTDALNSWCLESARRHIDLSPAAKLSQYQVRVSTTLPAPSDYRILSVFRKGVLCRMGQPSQQYFYEDQKSIYYATAEDPAFYITDDAISYLPALGEAADATTAALCIKYPSSINSAVLNEIENMPSELTDLVVLDVAIRALHQLLGILSTQYTALGTRLDTEEDIELSAAKMKEMETRISDFRVKIGTLRETYMMSLGAYTGRILAPQKEAAQ